LILFEIALQKCVVELDGKLGVAGDEVSVEQGAVHVDPRGYDGPIRADFARAVVGSTTATDVCSVPRRVQETPGRPLRVLGMPNRVGMLESLVDRWQQVLCNNMVETVFVGDSEVLLVHSGI
jgi:hypothetical protein